MAEVVGGLIVTDDTTVPEIEAAIIFLRESMRRAPKAFAPRYHARIDALLDEWVKRA